MSKFLLIIAAQKPLFCPKRSAMSYVFFEAEAYVSAFDAYRRFFEHWCGRSLSHLMAKTAQRQWFPAVMVSLMTDIHT